MTAQLKNKSYNHSYMNSAVPDIQVRQSGEGSLSYYDCGMQRTLLQAVTIISGV